MSNIAQPDIKVFTLDELKRTLVSTPVGTEVHVTEDLESIIENAIPTKKPSGGHMSFINGARYYLEDFDPASYVHELFAEIEAETKSQLIYDDMEHLWYTKVELRERKLTVPATEAKEPTSESTRPMKIESINNLIASVSDMKKTMDKMQQEFDRVLLALNALKN